MALIINEVEQLIFLNSSPKTGAVLFQRDWSLGTDRRSRATCGVVILIVIIARIQSRCAAECERGAVNRIATGLNSSVNDGAGFSAEFRLGILFGIEFLDGIDGQGCRRISGGNHRI